MLPLLQTGNWSMSTSIGNDSALYLIHPFADSTVSVIETMLDSGCTMGEIQPVSAGHRMHEVTSVIGISGKMAGAISFSIPAAGAMAVLERMTGIQPTEVDADVRDAIGEMANMIAGFGKRHLETYGLNISLPQVIVGADYTIHSPRWAQHYWLPITTDFSECSVDVGFDLPAS
jgi:chemotaxis protein CheX